MKTCQECRWARWKTPYGKRLPDNHLRCEHPVTLAPMPLLSAESNYKTARETLNINGPWQDKNDFRWPWSFKPELLYHCKELKTRQGAS